jgi:hypothetical protein
VTRNIVHGLVGVLGALSLGSAMVLAVPASPASAAPGSCGEGWNSENTEVRDTREAVLFYERHIEVRSGSVKTGPLAGTLEYWARITNAVPTDRVWLDWKRVGQSDWNQCGPVDVGSGNDVRATPGIRAIQQGTGTPGLFRKVRACGDMYVGRYREHKCTDWFVQ